MGPKNVSGFLIKSKEHFNFQIWKFYDPYSYENGENVGMEKWPLNHAENQKKNQSTEYDYRSGNMKNT